MKQILTLLGVVILLASCATNQQKNENLDTLSLEEWYNDVFNKTSFDTITTIPDYAFSTDWMQQYGEYITQHLERREDTWFSKDTAESFDCRYWTIAYVDNDTIPELLLYGGFGEIYEMRNGRFTEIASYNLNTDLVDTSEVSNFGLTLDSLKCHYAGGEIGDSVVHISEIELNGKHLGACFGYNQYVSCTGFTQVKQTLDALYYSKGANTYFPGILNTSRKPINELISKVK